MRRSLKYIRNFLNPYQSGTQAPYHTWWQKFHLDGPLLAALSTLLLLGLCILYSASGANWEVILRQLARIGLGFGFLFIFAQIPPIKYQQWIPWIFSAGLLLLIAVLFIGHTGKGAQRWLNLGLFRFQPSELMKLAVPMMVAAYLAEKPFPPRPIFLLFAGLLIILPALLIAKQPDLGTAILIVTAGLSALFLAGVSWRLIWGLSGLIAVSLPMLWYVMHDYQKQRVLNFLDPERDPLGSGYHIIQSKIAIGSGGIFGKGWLHGTQTHLQFLPEHSTDFIFAVFTEEFGLIGALTLLLVLLVLVGRSFYISSCAQDSFTRLLAGSLAFTFFVSFFVNIGMVTGVLPVVGLPLPLISYGGTAIVATMASFGILMSIHTHRKLLST